MVKEMYFFSRLRQREDHHGRASGALRRARSHRRSHPDEELLRQEAQQESVQGR